jgi:holo-ACP synthase CitX
MNQHLMALETKAFRIAKLLETEQLVISIQANVPGFDKNISEAHLLVRLFVHVIQDQLKGTQSFFFSSEAGPYAFLTLKSENPMEIKRMLMLIEDTHPLGRLIDLDVHIQTQSTSISRNQLGLEPRPCMICGGHTHVCRRTEKHSLETLITFIKHTVFHHIDSMIAGLIEDSITAELDIEHKFGLVTKTSQGSHPDMDYQLMIKARDALLPYFMEIFHQGYHADETKNLLNSSRSIGIKAEQAMLDATGGINCYKGLIFVLGLTCLSVGYVMSHQEPFEAIFRHIKIMSESLLDEFTDAKDSIGKQMYKTYGTLGVRGEAHLGFPSVKFGLSLLLNQTLSDGWIRHVLKEIALKTDDTVLIHRAGSLEQVRFFKDMLRHADVTQDKVAQKITQYAISKRLSLGGSADLLVATLFLHQVRSLIL